jgi:hypothetical protein
VAGLAFAALLAPLALLPGCPLTPDPEPKPPVDPRLNRETVETTIAYVAKVWSQRLYDEYEAVLHDEFEFFPRVDDLEDFPWIQGQSWGRTAELTMAENMFDPNFSGEEPPVQSIDMSLDILERHELDPGTWQVVCTSQVLVMTGPSDGFRADTRFRFVLVPDADEPGLYQVLDQAELARF